jgi:RNA polymerase sigma-70 factor (sigma-E family)
VSKAGPEFEPFVSARLPALVRFATALSGDPARADDLVQDALERAGARWSTVRGLDNPEAYVRKVIVNRHVSIWRRTRHEVLTALPADRAARAEPATGPASALWDVLATLPRGQRAVLVLRYYEDLSEAEIAAVLGCSVGSVKSQAAKAKHKVRAALGTESTWTT